MGKGGGGQGSDRRLCLEPIGGLARVERSVPDRSLRPAYTYGMVADVIIVRLYLELSAGLLNRERELDRCWLRRPVCRLSGEMHLPRPLGRYRHIERRSRVHQFVYASDEFQGP
jgi:hypothetical protein